MANTLLTTETVSSDFSTITITDTTTYTSPLRAAVGSFLGVYKISSSGGLSSVEVTPDTEDPLTVDSWDVPYEADGFYKIYQIAIPVFAVDSYASGDAVYDEDTETVYVSRVNDNETDVSDSVSWRTILTPSDLAEDLPANCDSIIKNKLFYDLTKEARYSASIEESILTVNPDKPTKFHYLDLFLEGMKSAEAVEDYTSGEIIARRAQGLI
jgi:hypothetical protein